MVATKKKGTLRDKHTGRTDRISRRGQSKSTVSPKRASGAKASASRSIADGWSGWDLGLGDEPSTQGQPSAQTNAQVRKDWRESRVTSALLALAIILSLMKIIGHYSPYEPWMGVTGFALGAAWAWVFVKERCDD